MRSKIESQRVQMARLKDSFELYPDDFSDVSNIATKEKPKKDDLN